MTYIVGWILFAHVAGPFVGMAIKNSQAVAK